MIACFGIVGTVFAATSEPRSLQYDVIAEFPHDPAVFTQGLEIHEGWLFESGGGYGRSSVSGRPLRQTGNERRRSGPAGVFFEGLSWVGQELFLLTWRERRVYVLDARLALRRQYTLPGEGWGLTRWPRPDGDRLLLSDGSADLQEIDPKGWRVLGRRTVRANGRPVEDLNELEYADGRVYANLWHNDRIAVIDPRDGTVESWLDLGALKQRFRKPDGWDASEHVLNGIAYDPESGHFFVTGKCWPTLFEIRIEKGLDRRSGS